MNKKNTLIFTATTLIVAGVILYKKYNKRKVVKSYDKKFKLNINNKWTIENSDNNTNLELVNKSKNIYLMMYSEKKNNSVSLEEYNSYIVASINNNIITQDKIKLGENNTIINIFPDDNINYFLYTVETKNYFHKFIIASFKKSSININYTNYILSTLKEV